MSDQRDNQTDDMEAEDVGDIMAGDRRIARSDTALPDWYVSDTAYRPIPIVWLASALFMQVLAQPAIFFILHTAFGFGPLMTFSFALLATGIIWHFTWERGMRDAGSAWQIATALTLAFFLAITALGLAALG